MQTYVVVLSLILALNASAQTNIYEVAGFAKDALVNTENVPTDFRLYVPDTASQILINPARAATASMRFLYGSRFAFNQPTLAATTLLGRKRTKWLIRVESALANETSEDEEHLESQDQGTGYTLEQKTDSQFRFETEDYAARMQISGIRQTRFGGMAFGVFGALERRDTQNRFFGETFSRQEFEEADGPSRALLAQRFRAEGLSLDQSKYVVGLETAFVGADWDAIAALTYQRASNDGEISDLDERTTIDTLFFSEDSLIRRNELDVSEESLRDQTPEVWRLRGYLQKQTDPNSHLFLAVEASRTLSNRVAAEFTQETARRSDNDGVVSVDTLNVSGEAEEEGDFWRVRAAVGYVMVRHIQRLHFLAGISPHVMYSEADDIVGAYAVFRRRVQVGERFAPVTPVFDNREQLLLMSLTIPLYCNFSVTDRVSTFGGVNYSFVFEDFEIQGQSISTAANAEEIHDVDRTALRSESEFYLGLSLEHASGLVGHVAFSGDLSQIERWNISFGYHF